MSSLGPETDEGSPVIPGETVGPSPAPPSLGVRVGLPTSGPPRLPTPVPGRGHRTSERELDRDVGRTSQKGHWRERTRGPLTPTVTRRDPRVQPFPQRDQGPTRGAGGPWDAPPPVHVPRTWGQGWYVTPGGGSGRSSPRRGTALWEEREPWGGHKSPGQPWAQRGGVGEGREDPPQGLSSSDP